MSDPNLFVLILNIAILIGAAYYFLFLRDKLRSHDD